MIIEGEFYYYILLVMLTYLENSKIWSPYNHFGPKMSMQCTLKMMQSSLQAIEFPSVGRIVNKIDLMLWSIVMRNLHV